MEVSVIAFGVEMTNSRGELDRGKYTAALLCAGLLSNCREDFNGRRRILWDGRGTTAVNN